MISSPQTAPPEVAVDGQLFLFLLISNQTYSLHYTSTLSRLSYSLHDSPDICKTCYSRKQFLTLRKDIYWHNKRSTDTIKEKTISDAPVYQWKAIPSTYPPFGPISPPMTVSAHFNKWSLLWSNARMRTSGWFCSKVGPKYPLIKSSSYEGSNVHASQGAGNSGSFWGVIAQIGTPKNVCSQKCRC